MEKQKSEEKTEERIRWTQSTHEDAGAHTPDAALRFHL